MNISKLAVRRGVTFAMLYMLIIGFGFFSFSQLKLDLYPDITFPVVAVLTQYQGVSPKDIETLVSKPLEGAVSQVKGVEKVTSNSANGASIIIIEFTWGTDMDQAEYDVRKYIDMVRDYLPDDADDSIIFAFDPSLTPILFMGISSDTIDQAKLRKIITDEFEPRVERIEGVASVETNGGLEREIQIKVNPDKLFLYNISIDKIVNAIRYENLQLPSGQIEDGQLEFSIRTVGEFTEVEQIENVVVGFSGMTPILVKNVAKVIDSHKEQRNIIRNNYRNGLVMLVNKQSDANTVATCRRILRELPGIYKKLPEGIDYGIIFNQEEFIQKSISNLSTTAMQAFLVSGLVLLMFLRNLRASIIVAVSIPTSVIATFAVMQQAGITLNIISMAGLALAIGMLLDNSIVVLESIFIQYEHGHDSKESAIKGCSEVAMAITASTLTTLAVFVPILFVPGIAGVMFNDMAITICFSLTVSLIIALTLIPLLTSRFLRKDSNNVDRIKFTNLKIVKIIIYPLKLLAKPINKPYNKTKNAVSKRIERILNGMEERYTAMIQWVVTHKKITIFSTLGIFIVSIVLVGIVGADFMPATDRGRINFELKLKPGTKLAETEKMFIKVENIIKELYPDEVENIYSNIGVGEGFASIFNNYGSHGGTLQVKLTSRREREATQFEIQEKIKERVSEIAGAELNVSNRQGAMFGGAGSIEIKLFGNDLDVARMLSAEVKAKVEKIPGAVDVVSNMEEGIPELRIIPNRLKLAQTGLNVATLSNTVSSNILGSVATMYREGGNEYNILVRLDKTSRDSIQDVENVLITTPLGKHVLLKSVAKVEKEKSPTTVFREDQKRVATVTLGVFDRDLGGVIADINEMFRSKISMPPDFRYELGGTAEDMQESFMYLGIALVASIFVVYMVMASQFESLLSPFIIIFTIPFAFIGVGFACFITQTPLSLMVLIGGVMLSGIVVNNGIVLVDYANLLIRERGMQLQEALVTAGKRRMRPILMTALTTIFSMVPLALGLGEAGEIWSPMAIAVIGGLTASTFLTLLIIPTVFLVIEVLKRRLTNATMQKST